MITAKEAYEIIKERSKMPITYLMESEDSFLSAPEEYLSVSKDTGEVEVFYSYASYILKIADDSKFILLDEMFEDFMRFYKKNASEKCLADLYASAWNRLYYHNDGDLNDYRIDEEGQEIISHWNNIEQRLYADILQIIDNEGIDYPPTVLEKFDDPYYRIKPFMIRNGWTTNDVNRTWTIYDNRD